MPRYTADAIRNIALVGQSGSGKTTLLRIIMGEIEPLEGRVRRGPATPGVGHYG